MTDPVQPQRLACGAPVAPLVDQIADGRAQTLTAHQQTCRACQAALADLDGQWAPVRRARSEPIAVPRDMVTAVMRRVRDLSPAWSTPVAHRRRGTTQVTRAVVETVVGRAAGAVTGVVLVAGRAARPAPGPRPPDQMPGVEVDVWLVTDEDIPIPDVARRVRARVTRDLSALTGLAVDRFGVSVDAVSASPAGPTAQPV